MLAVQAQGPFEFLGTESALENVRILWRVFQTSRGGHFQRRTITDYNIRMCMLMRVKVFICMRRKIFSVKCCTGDKNSLVTLFTIPLNFACGVLECLQTAQGQQTCYYYCCCWFCCCCHSDCLQLHFGHRCFQLHLQGRVTKSSANHLYPSSQRLDPLMH